MRRVLPGIVVGLLVVGAAIWFWPLVQPMLHNPFAAERFDESKWKAAVGDEARNPRGPMAEDLRRHHLRVGMSKEQVRRLLGPPGNSESDEKAGNVDSYFLGYWGWMSMEGDPLIIHYDRAGRVTSTEISEH